MSQTPGKLERRARALLRAYPADYRHGRAEEIMGTLLVAAGDQVHAGAVVRVVGEIFDAVRDGRSRARMQ